MKLGLKSEAISHGLQQIRFLSQDESYVYNVSAAGIAGSVAHVLTHS